MRTLFFNGKNFSIDDYGIVLDSDYSLIIDTEGQLSRFNRNNDLFVPEINPLEIRSVLEARYGEVKGLVHLVVNEGKPDEKRLSSPDFKQKCTSARCKIGFYIRSLVRKGLHALGLTEEEHDNLRSFQEGLKDAFCSEEDLIIGNTNYKVF
jgi:hypothetical protein